MQDLRSAFLAALERALLAVRYFPESTYRVQFHAGFTFRDALQIVPYLHDLGITHLYASPLLQARPGSTHGYDTTSYQAFNPELGTAEDYEMLCQALQSHNMGQVLDIVPNHMGVAGQFYELKIDDKVRYGQKNAQGEARFIVYHDTSRNPFQVSNQTGVLTCSLILTRYYHV